MTVRAIPLTDQPPAPSLHVPFLERASESDSREKAHALGAFLTLRLIDRIAQERGAPGSAALTYQLNACENYLDELHPQTKDLSHLREIVRVARRVRTASSRRLLWSPLLAYGYWLENELRLDESLDVLETALRLRDGEHPAEIAAYLQHGRVLRQTGRFNDARASYAAAGDLAQSLGDQRSHLVSRIGRAWVTLKSGDLPGAEQELRDVLAAARDLGDSFVEARACHDLAATMFYMDRTTKAVPLAFRAFELYEEPTQRARALNDVGVFLKELGHYSAAKEAFLVVLDRRPGAELRVKTVLELLALSAAVQDRLGFERWRKELESQYDMLPPEERAEFDTKLGGGLAAFGNSEDAAERLSRAVAVAEEYKLGQRLFEAERLLLEIEEGNNASKEALSPRAEEVPADPEVRAAIEGLYALRSGN
ncbi:MAG: hypothetical protein HY560_01855 [Gemmatimonadetes bacterium]|nr:hypothetical protein [Gemmatimonadota bacterium]